MIKLHVTLGNNSFIFRSEDATSQDLDHLRPFFYLWVQAQADQSPELQELVDRLRTSRERLTQIIDTVSQSTGVKAHVGSEPAGE